MNAHWPDPLKPPESMRRWLEIRAFEPAAINPRRDVTIFLLLAFALLCHSSPACSEELYRQFSLSGGKLTMAPADIKAPEPGVVTAKYGFKISNEFMPYMGTGLAYSYQPDVKTGDMINLRTGIAAQFGFDYLLGTNLTLKFDYKYLSLPPEQTRGDTRTPQSLGIGLDIKF